MSSDNLRNDFRGSRLYPLDRMKALEGWEVQTITNEYRYTYVFTKTIHQGTYDSNGWRRGSNGWQMWTSEKKIRQFLSRSVAYTDEKFTNLLKKDLEEKQQKENEKRKERKWERRRDCKRSCYKRKNEKRKNNGRESKERKKNKKVLVSIFVVVELDAPSVDVGETFAFGEFVGRQNQKT